MKTSTTGWAIHTGTGFLGRYWHSNAPMHPNFTGYRVAVWETRREARVVLKTTRTPYGFPTARVVRVRVTVSVVKERT